MKVRYRDGACKAGHWNRVTDPRVPQKIPPPRRGGIGSSGG
jgi:hypothetical protein